MRCQGTGRDRRELIIVVTTEYGVLPRLDLDRCDTAYNHMVEITE